MKRKKKLAQTFECNTAQRRKKKNPLEPATPKANQGRGAVFQRKEESKKPDWHYGRVGFFSGGGDGRDIKGTSILPTIQKKRKRNPMAESNVNRNHQEQKDRFCQESRREKVRKANT